MIDHCCYHHVAGDIYAGEREDHFFRFSLLCQAAIEAVWHVPCGGFPYGEDNLIFVANDWHTSLLPVYLQAFYRDHGKFEFARSVLIVHNLAFQGRAPLKEFDNFGIPANYKERFYLDDPFGGECMNMMQAGMELATKVVAVSQGYAWEITTDMGGWGLAPMLRDMGDKLSGVVNGIDLDEWSPEIDEHLDGDGYAQYEPNAAGLENGKPKCKAALQAEMGLPVRDDVPLFGFIGRLDHQKGVDLITECQHWLLGGQDVQVIMLGSGREDLENELREMESRNPEKCKAYVGFSVAMAHRMTAGCDMLLMPSRFEPCGLNQLYAMRYGTVPIVHAVGGLRETVTQFNPDSDEGTGWTFDTCEAHKFQEALGYALGTYREHKDQFRKIQMRGMAKDVSWDFSAEKYEDTLIDAKYCW